MSTLRAFATSVSAVLAIGAVFGASTGQTHHKKHKAHKAHHKAIAAKPRKYPKVLPPISVDGRTKLMRARRAAALHATQSIKVGQLQTGIPSKFSTVDDLHKWADSLRYRDASGTMIQYPWHVNIDTAGGAKTLYILTVYPYGTTDQGDVAVWESGPTGMVLQAWQNNVNLAWPQDSGSVDQVSDTTFVVQPDNGQYQEVWLNPYTALLWGGNYGTGYIYSVPGGPVRSRGGG